MLASIQALKTLRGDTFSSALVSVWYCRRHGIDLLGLTVRVIGDVEDERERCALHDHACAV